MGGRRLTGHLMARERSRGVLGGQGGDQAARHVWGEQGVAACHHADGADQVLRLGVFHQEAAGTGPKCLVNVLVGLEGGQDEHLHPGEVIVAIVCATTSCSSRAIRSRSSSTWRRASRSARSRSDST